MCVCVGVGVCMYVCVCVGVGVHACTITFAGTEGEGVAPLVRVQADNQGDSGMGGVHPFEKVHSTHTCSLVPRPAVNGTIFYSSRGRGGR